jgi:hypothetical protein
MPTEFPSVVDLPLFSRFWKDNGRLQEAKTVPFRSMKMARDTGTDAVRLLQNAFLFIEGLPAPKGTFGPFAIPISEANGEDASKCVFGPFTKRAVETFQRQNGGLTIDGMAGIMTLRAMDVLLLTHFDPLFPDDQSL